MHIYIYISIFNNLLLHFGHGRDIDVVIAVVDIVTGFVVVGCGLQCFWCYIRCRLIANFLKYLKIYLFSSFPSFF